MKKFLPYIGLVGWLLVAGFSAALYPAYFKIDCHFMSGWIFCNTPLTTVGLKIISFMLIFVFISTLIVSGYVLWKKYQQSGLEKGIWLALAGLCLFLAFLTVPFGSSDTTYYFSAGKTMNAGLNPFVDEWTFKRDFTGPVRTEPVVGFSYGPIMAMIFKGIYQISFDNAAIFITFWKLFLAVVLIAAGWVVYRLLQTQETKISRAQFLAFWILQPLILFEVLVNGHFDVFWLLFVLLAIWAAMRNKWWLVIPLLVVGVWIKFLPILVTPFFVVWWWQETTRATWLKQVGQAIAGSLLGAAITVIVWQGLWQGFKVFNLIAMQSKWAADSVFSVIYYSLKPLFVWLLAGQAHWYLTRLVQGGLLLLMICLFWPYLKKMVLILLKKYSMTPENYVQMIFFGLFIYLSLWQKSFWPWYVAWLIPLGILVYERSRNVLLGRFLIWISLVPLSFYPLWLFNWYVRKTDAVGELWFQQLFVALVWAYPLYVIFKLSKKNFNLDSAVEAENNSSFHPLFFILRQVYRVIFVWPFQLVVLIVEQFSSSSPLKNKEPASYCFIITSVIYPKQKELSYASTRSVYNPEERAAQTLKTIQSVKEKVPGAKIVLVESGLQENLPLDLAKQVDQYLYVGNKFFVRQACDSKFKSLGEAIMLLCSIKHIKFNAEAFFKLSGRYFLDENFSVNSWQTNLFKFFYIREDYVSTRLYSFGNKMLRTWQFALIKGLPLMLLDYPVEHILARFVPKKYIQTIDKVGVMGADATSGKIIKE